MMKRFLLGLGVLVLGIWASPESVVRMSPEVSLAEAGFGGGRGGGGARAQPMGRPSGARARPAGRPAQAARPAGRPVQGTARPNRPNQGIATRPNRPTGAFPGSDYRPNRPDAGNRPNRPEPGYRPNRPDPGYLPNRPGRPGVRPPNYRPPHYRPPYYRPPSWRPPYYRPPYYRPPHWRWGSYYYYPAWGWYFTAAVAGATLVYVATLPDNRECEEVRLGNETLYECNGVLYRSTLYNDERVYEIVSSAEESAIVAPPDAPVGPLLLSTPRMRGSAVREVQAALVALGYSVGGPVDGIFGPATDRAVRAFQADYGLRQTGVVDDATAAALGL